MDAKRGMIHGRWTDAIWRTALVAGFVAGVGAGPALAQDPNSPDDAVPVRVGRLADVGGDVYLAPEDRAADWGLVGLNYPVATGDNLWVAEGGRAEIDVGAGQIRLAGETNIHVSRLDDRTVAFFVAQGSATLRLRVLDAGEVARIDTPVTQVVITRPGLYRVDVSPDRQRTVVVVREGEATLPTQAGMQQVLPGQTAVAEGLDATRVDVRNGIATDGFDTWTANRDRRYERSRTSTYVSRQMVGYADLDEYGSWETDASYGAVWYPTYVDAGWAPYRNGNWTWVSPYGWTWVDYAPWGYAPFHYGRWVHAGGRWGWCPGAYVARPHWSPAMVGWVGGAGWGPSLALNAPVYGWVPLAWGEPYRPGWNRCSTRCWNNYNRPFAVRVDERTRNAVPTEYVNANRPGGLTAVPGAAFSGSKPVARNLVPVNAGQVTGTAVLAGAPMIDRPGARYVPMVKPGAANTPVPASTLYATRRGYGTSRPTEGVVGAPIETRSLAPSTALPARPVAPPVLSPPSAAPSYATPPPSYAAPAAKPAPSGVSPGAPSVQRSAPPTFTVPVQRETVQAHVPPPAPSVPSRGSAPVMMAPSTPAAPRFVPQAPPMPPAASTPGAAPVARSAAPMQPPAVQHASPPPAVQQAAPPPPAANKPNADNARQAQDRGANDGGGQRGGGNDKPGPGR